MTGSSNQIADQALNSTSSPTFNLLSVNNLLTIAEINNIDGSIPTINLTTTSKQLQILVYDGSATSANIILPNATTLQVGRKFQIALSSANNPGTESVVIYNFFSGDQLASLPSLLTPCSVTFTLLDNSASDGIWDVANELPIGASPGTILYYDSANWTPTAATYPVTTTINQILYSSANNVISEISTVNSSVLITSSGGVPSLSTTLPSGIAATNMALTTPNIGVATAASITFGGSVLSNYVARTAWTPTITFATPGDLSVSYATQVGFYSRIGSIVDVSFSLTFTPTYTTASGQISIAGLPLTSNSTANNNSFGTLVVSAPAFPALTTSLYCTIVPNSSSITLGAAGSGTSIVNFSVTQFTTGVARSVFGSIRYFV